MRAEYDVTHDALYVEILTEHQGPVRTECLDGDVLLADYDGDSLYGLEFLTPRKHYKQLAVIAAAHGFAHLLDDIYTVMGMALGASTSGAWQLTGVEVSAGTPVST